MSLMGFSAWWTIVPRGYLKSCNFFHWLHCTPKFKNTAFSIAVYIQDRLEMKLGPSKPLFHSYLIVLFYDPGLSYLRILTICLLLVYFVSAAGCHCFDLYELDGFLCMVDHWSPRLPEILQIFSLASLHSKI